jgi:hypothetical protein
MRTRKSRRFRPELSDGLEDRWVPAPLTLFNPMVANVATLNTANPYSVTNSGIGSFGTGGTFSPALNVQTPLTAAGTASTGVAPAGAITTPSIVNGVGFFGGVGGVGLNNGLSPVASLAINGGEPEIPNAATPSFAGAGYVPTELETQSGLFPTVLEPNSGLAFYGNNNFLPDTAANAPTAQNFYANDYTTGVGFLNGAGLSNAQGLAAPNIAYSNSTTPVGIFGVNYGLLLNAPLTLNLGTGMLGGTSSFVPATGEGTGFVLGSGSATMTRSMAPR